MSELFLNTAVVGSSLILLYLSFRMASFVRELHDLGETAPAFRVSWPLVTVIVPACNEEETIKEALGSLLRVDYPALEIILINDRSTDQTGPIMEAMAKKDARVRVFHVTALPEGWLGKPHALFLGTREARGDYYLFTDADIVFSRDSLKRAVTLMERDDLAMLTLMPQLKANGWALKLALAYFFHSAMITASPKKIRDPKSRQAAGMGAFNLVRAEAFRRTPGFQWLKGEVVEDIATGYMMKKHGGAVAMLSGRGLLSLEWYPSLKALVKGLEKNYFAVLEYSLPLTLIYLLALYLPWFGATILPFFAASAAQYFALTVWLIYVLTTMVVMRRLDHPWWTALFFPVVIPLFPFILVRSAFLCMKRGGIIWRGTFYDLAFLRSNQRFKLRDYFKDQRA